MSRAWNSERAADREEDALAEDYHAGRITRAEYNAGLRDIQQGMREAYEADMEDARERVRDEWGGW